MYTVKELVEHLQHYNQDAVIVMSSDEEGNDYHYLRNLEELMYDPEDRWVGYAEITDELRKQGYTEEDVMEGGILALVLWA